jgi:CRISPR/Cas system-associated exonuclease Cas4 (RecB family)
MGLELPPNIYLVRGKIVHSVLEDLFKVDIDSVNNSHYEFELRIVMQSLFKEKWIAAKDDLDELGLGDNKLNFFYDESVEMLNNWFDNFIGKVISKAKKVGFKEAFLVVKPETEVYYKSDEHMVQGFVDAVVSDNEVVSLIDYKSSRRDIVTSGYRLQLAIYALLYEEKHGTKPDFVGIDFLKHNSKIISVDDELVDLAKREAKLIQEKTVSEDIKDYPKGNGPFCDCKKYEDLLEKRSLREFIKP